MITLPQVKAAVISRLKGAIPVTSLLVDVNGTPRTEEIRELEWQGTKFAYPNIRVRVEQFNPRNINCTQVDCLVHIYVFGEKYSSLTIDEIASQCLILFHGNPFQAANSIKLTAISCEQVGADRLEDGVWLGVVKMKALAS